MRSLLVAPLCAVTLVTAACTGGDNAPGPDATAGGSTDATPSETLAPAPAVTESVFDENDDVLDVAIPEPASLDPMRIQDPGSALVARQLYEGLTRWDPALEKVRPAAAEEWRVSPDGRTFLFRLRPGMSFHDGTPVTSRSFAFAFDRIALKENASDLAYLLELVVGYDEVNRAGTSRHLSGVTTPDELTLSITLTEPFHDLPALLTHPGLVPLPESAVRDVDRFLTEPVGNGPFQIAQPWTPGASVVLESFAGFIETPDLDGIRFITFNDAAASWVEFLRGDLDVSEVPAGQVEDASEQFGDAGFVSFLKQEYLGVNVEAVSDVRVRRAVSLAIDREAISSAIFKRTMQPARGIVPVGIPGFQENVCLTACSYRPEAARRIVKQVARSDRRVVLEYTRGSPHVDVARAARKDLEAVGLKVKLKAYRFSAFLRKLRDGSAGLFRLGWIGEYPSADVFLTPLFRSTSSDNHSSYRSARVDELVSQARRAASDGRRRRLYALAEKTILRDLPVIPIGSFITRWAVHEHVRGMGFDVMGGFDAADVSLEQG